MKTTHLKLVLRYTLLLALLALLVSACGSGSGNEATAPSAQGGAEEMAASLAAACEEQPVPGAASYDPAAGTRPTVVLRGKPGSTWRLDTSYTRAGWQPQALQDVQLVACLQNEATLVETCPYTLENGRSASIERYRYVTSIWLYEARTGELVAETSWTGSDPALCSTETTFEEGETVKKVYGVAVGAREVGDWLQPHVELAAVPTAAATDTPLPPPTPSADDLVAAAIEFYEQGNLDAAMAELQQALKLEPDNADAHRNLGTVHSEREQWSEAVGAYQKAIELAPDFGEAYADLAAAYIGLGNLADAAAAAEKGIELAPDYAMAYNNLAVAHGAQGDIEGAMTLLQKAIEVDPECADAHYNLGYAFESLGQSTEAISAYQAAIQADPAYADAYENLGGIYARLGQMDQAIDWWMQTLELEPERASTHMNLGMAYSQLGQEEEAIAAFERYLELAPADDPDRAQVESWLTDLAEPRAQEYRSEADGFGLRYPAGWVYNQGGNQVLFAATQEELEGAIPGLVFKVGFITGPLADIAESAGLEELTDPIVALETFAASMEVQLGPADTGTISGYPAALAPMSGSIQDVAYLGDLVIVLVDERAVVGMAFAPPDEWETLRPIFLDMVNSLFFFEP